MVGRVVELTLKGSLLESPYGTARPLGTFSALVPIHGGRVQPKHYVVRGLLCYYRQPWAEKMSGKHKRDDVRKSTFILLRVQWHVHHERDDFCSGLRATSSALAGGLY